MTTTRSLPRLLTLGAALVLVASACSSPGGSGAPAGSGGTGGGPTWTPDATLLAAAKAEGELNVIALPHDWCNYGDQLKNFKATTGLKVNENDPNAGSGTEIDAIKNNPNGGPAAPDTVDVGYSFGDANKDLYQPYKVATFDSIPPEQKAADGSWVGDYYGVLSFEINKDIIKGDNPKDWKDLLDPKYAHSVALAGDPLNSNQAIQSVQAAALGNGGTLDNAQAGLDFFKKLNDAGNFVPTVAKQGTLVNGETPIVITWSYLALADRDKLKGTNNIEVVIPATGKFGGIYVQAISKTAPHPNAAKLWEEYLYSDQGQLVWTNAYCYTTRYSDLVAKNVISGDLKAKLPDVTGTVFPTNDQLTAAKTLITGQWASVTGLGPLKTPPPAP
ncbi:MAG TPA: ABC transporter substrate-binding protein [Patescibacteria group bacterium]|nr:ABC transporter substrate-binding protein [Patescibacteria group bacterium]